MAQYFSSLEAFYARSSAGPQFVGEFSAAFSAGGLADADNPILSPSIPFLLDQRPGTGYVAEVVGQLTTDGPATAWIQTIDGATGWFLNGSFVDNGGIAPIQAVPTIGIGRNTTQYRLAFSGAARTAIVALAGTNISLNVNIHYRPQRFFSGYWQAYATFGEFIDSPPNTISNSQNTTVSNMTSALDGLLSTQLANTGPRYRLSGTNDPDRYADNCSYATIDVTGFVTVEASDIGNGVGQIPTNVADNSAARFRQHPNTFFRAYNDKIRGAAVRRTDTVAVNTINANQPIGLYVNGSVIPNSNWLIIVDGTPHIVRLNTSLSCYTPLQLWNQVWAPLIGGSDSIRRSASINGSVKLNKTSYLSYARMLDRVGTITTQDNTAPLG